VKPAYSNADASFGESPSPAYSFSLPVDSTAMVFPKNRRYHGLRLENGLWIKWVPSPALAKWKSTPMET
jgi:hypothetical protein